MGVVMSVYILSYRGGIGEELYYKDVWVKCENLVWKITEAQKVCGHGSIGRALLIKWESKNQTSVWPKKRKQNYKMSASIQKFQIL
jgi:hypothetical protein